MAYNEVRGGQKKSLKKLCHIFFLLFADDMRFFFAGDYFRVVEFLTIVLSFFLAWGYLNLRVYRLY